MRKTRRDLDYFEDDATLDDVRPRSCGVAAHVFATPYRSIWSYRPYTFVWWGKNRATNT